MYGSNESFNLHTCQLKESAATSRTSLCVVINDRSTFQEVISRFFRVARGARRTLHWSHRSCLIATKSQTTPSKLDETYRCPSNFLVSPESCSKQRHRSSTITYKIGDNYFGKKKIASTMRAGKPNKHKYASRGTD